MKHAKLFKINLVLIIALLCLNCGGKTQSSDEATGESLSAVQLIAKADNLYKQREDLTKLRDGLQLLRRARVAEGNNYEAAWKLAKFNYFMGNNTKDEDLRDRSFKDGITAGKSAIKLQPEKADGYFWLGANLGGQASGNVLDGAANLSEIRQNMNKVIEIQPDYQGAMAYVVLAQTELETRGLMGGSAEKAADYLEQALKLNKENSFIYLYLAESYFYTNRKAEAKKMLDAMRNMPPSPDYLPERREAEEKAKKLEAKF
ncbi:MAG: TRAP transporter TatT component family protein [Pyrinomonadaceae bacterium]